MGPYRLKQLMLSADTPVDLAMRVRSRIALWNPPMSPIQGTGDVFVAEDTRERPPAEVALKLLGPAATADAHVMAELRDAIDRIAAFEHLSAPRIVECDGRSAVLMTLIEAPSLAEKVHDEGPIAVASAVDRFMGIAGALNVTDLAHGRLTAGRVLVDDTGRISIVGWDTGRLDGGPRATARDDVAALAHILLTMLCGPQATDDSVVDPRVPHWLADILTRAIAGGHYARVPDLTSAVDKMRPNSYEYFPPPKPSARHGLHRTAVVVAVLAALGLGATWLTVGARPADRPPSIAVGRSPIDIAAEPGGLAFTSNFTDGTVSLIPDRIHSVPIPVSNHPVGVVADPHLAKLYVIELDGSLVVVDVALRRVIRRIPVGPGPLGLAVGRTGDAYVTTSGTRDVAVVDPTAGTVIKRIPVLAGNPVDVVTKPDGKAAYVVTHNPATLTVVDTATNAAITAPIPLPPGFSPERAVASAKDMVYLSDPNSQDIVAVDARTRSVTRLSTPVGADVAGMALSPDESTLYLSRRQPNQIVALHLDEPSTLEVVANLTEEPGTMAVVADEIQPARDRRSKLVVALPRRNQVITVMIG